MAALNTIIEPLIPAIAALVNAMDKIDKFPDEILAAPRTHRHNLKHEIESSLENAISSINPNKYVNALFVVLLEGVIPKIPEIFSNARYVLNEKALPYLAKFEKTTPYQSLRNLIASAHAVSDKECQTAIRKLDQNETNRRMQNLYSIWLRTHTDEGEQRAESAIMAAARISENLYQPYIRTLHWLFRLARNNQDNASLGKMPYGAVYNELLNSTFQSDYPGLFLRDAVLIRNAEAHGTWEYYPDKNEISVYDGKVSSKRFPINELISRTEEMIVLSYELLPGYINIINLEKLHALENVIGEIKNVFPDLVSSDPARREAAWQSLERWVRVQAKIPL